MIQVGDIVTKSKGYDYDGIVVSKFETTKEAIRFVAEHADSGMLHIFNEGQLDYAEKTYAETVLWRINNREDFDDERFKMTKELME